MHIMMVHHIISNPILSDYMNKILRYDFIMRINSKGALKINVTRNSVGFYIINA